MAGREIKAGKAFVEITLRNGLQAGLKRAAAQLRAFASVTSAVGAGLTAASGAILGPLTAAVNVFSDLGDAVHKMAARTGMSAEAVSELAHAAGLSGTNIPTLETGVRRMQQTIGEAAMGVTMAKDALASLGLSASDVASQSPDQQLATIADRMAAIEDPAMRTAIAMDIFGRSGTQLLPMFANGAAGMQAMRDQAQALGLTISTDAANSAAKLTDALGTMWSALKAVTLNIGSALAPIVTDAADRISAIAASITKFAQKNQQLIVTVAGVAAGIGVAGAAFLTLGGLAAIASVATSGLASAVGLVGAVLGGIAAAVGAVLSPIGLLVTGIVAAAGSWLYFSGVGRQVVDWITSRFGRLVEFVREVVGGIGNALMAGDLQLAARIAWAGVRVAFYCGVEGISGVWQRIKDVASDTWQQIALGASHVVSYVKNMFGGIGETITNVFGSVTTFLGNVFGGYLQAGASVASGLLSAFKSFKDGAIESLSAIATAMMQGEFALAGEIAWTSIKLAFSEGIAWVTNAWGEFATGLTSVWDNVITNIRQAWNNVSSWIAGQLLKLVDTVNSVLASLEQIDPTGSASKLKASLDIDVNGAIAFLEEDRQRFNRGLDVAKQQRDEQRVQAMQARLAETEKRLAELRAARADAVAKARDLAPETGEEESPLSQAVRWMRRPRHPNCSIRKRPVTQWLLRVVWTA